MIKQSPLFATGGAQGRGQQGGFTLLEVLIAVVVLAIGLLGVASLQYAGMKSSQDAYSRSQGSFLAYAIADSIRSNNDAALAGSYDIGVADDGAGAPICEGPLRNCSPDEMAQWDLFRWKQSMSTLLPDGNGSIERQVDPVSGLPFAVISVTWASLQGDGDALGVQVRVEL